MPKIKSHSGAKKRFRKSSAGKWKHKKSGHRHLLDPMSAKRGRQLRRADVLNKTESKTLDNYLPYE